MGDDAIKFGMLQSFGGDQPPADKKIFGVAIATVLNNIDYTGGARVMLMLPWLPGYTPWARIATPMAGMGRGMYFVPQIGDEVLVAFNHGDVREPFVIGSCWNSTDRPPAALQTDPVTLRKIRTPLGHELSFDETEQSVTLTSNSQSKVTLNLEKAELSTPFATVTIGKAGDISITAKTKLTLNAPIVEIKADTVLTAKSNGTASFGASGPCELTGAIVKIN